MASDLTPTRRAALDLVADGKLILRTPAGATQGVWLWSGARTQGREPSAALNWLLANGYITLGEPIQRGGAQVATALACAQPTD